MCLTYHDATYSETVSYDLVDGVWTYNSTDTSESSGGGSGGGGDTPADNGIFVFDVNDESNYSNFNNYVLTDSAFTSLVDAIENNKIIYLLNTYGGKIIVLGVQDNTQGGDNGYTLWCYFYGSIYNYEFETDTKRLYPNNP